MNRTIPFILLVTIAMATACGLARADSRTERPLQVQLDLSGVSVGYHFSERVFVGITHQAEVSRSNEDCAVCGDDPETRIYDQNRVQDADYVFGDRSSLEVRLSPWEFGVYFALGILSVDRDVQRISYEAAPRVVGNNAYNDAGIQMELRSKPYTSLAVGMGVNHVFDFGLSLSVGFIVGLSPEDEPEITATSFGAEPASQADLDLFKRKVEDDYLEFPPVGVFHLAIGYNF